MVRENSVPQTGQGPENPRWAQLREAERSLGQLELHMPMDPVLADGRRIDKLKGDIAQLEWELHPPNHSENTILLPTDSGQLFLCQDGLIRLEKELRTVQTTDNELTLRNRYRIAIIGYVLKYNYFDLKNPPPEIRRIPAKLDPFLVDSSGSEVLPIDEVILEKAYGDIASSVKRFLAQERSSN